MPRKRKADSTEPTKSPSPRKRITRSAVSSTTSGYWSTVLRPVSTGPITTTFAIDGTSTAVQDTPTPSPTKPKRRGRPPKATTTSKPSPQKSSTQADTSNPPPALPTDESSQDDELLLVSSRRRGERLVTPTPGTPRAGSSRYVFDFVEITTPSKFQSGSRSDAFSPSRVPQDSGGSMGATPSTPRRRAQARPTTPTRSSPRKPPSRSPRKQNVQVAEEQLFPQPNGINIESFPRKGRPNSKAKPSSPVRRNTHLPDHLRDNIRLQQRASLRLLQKLPISTVDLSEEDEDEPSVNAMAYSQLLDLLIGTVQRGEGNSCILTGPRGSGKTQLVERALSELPETPIVIRLSGYTQTNDRLAIREVAYQLMQQTGTSPIPSEHLEEQPLDDEENPFLDAPGPSSTLPPSAHLLALISMIPTLSRPTIIIIDAFDSFALHPLQSLLYCLFDTIQHNKGGLKGKGMSVVGVTTRIDTVNLLEKRVKSRFSGRIFRTSSPSNLDHWIGLARAALCASSDSDPDDEWASAWNSSVDEFLRDPKVIDTFAETFSLSRDVRLLCRILTGIVVDLTPSSPFPTWSKLQSAITTQRCPPPYPYLSGLSYPCIGLLIAAKHAETSGHDTFTFEMLFEAFNDQVRMSLSAPVHVEGGGIGMMRCTREVMVGAFERLVSLRIFSAAGPASSGTTKEFIKFRCTIDRAQVKQAVEKRGQLNLKKWFTKAT